MAKMTLVGNLVRDAEVVTKGDNTFGAFTMAVNAVKDGPVVYFDGYAGEKIAPYLKKGAQVFVAADGFEQVIEQYKGKDGSDQVAVKNKLIRAEIELGDFVYVSARGRLAADITALDERGFALPRLLSNGRKDKDGNDPAPTATSFIVGDKLLAAYAKSNVDVSAGREVIAQGPATVRGYTTKEGEARAEIRLGNTAVTLGRAKKDKAEDAPQTPATADAGSGFDDDDIPF